MNFSAPIKRIVGAVAGSTDTISNNLWAIGLVGVIGFPLYYPVWVYLLPQPYENLYLRLLGSALCLGLALNSYWSTAARKWLPLYWHLCVFYCLPFYFSFMYLMNHGSQVSVLSALTGAFLLIMVVDWIALLMHALIGLLAGWLVFSWVAPGTPIPETSPEFLAILLFAFVGGAVFSYRKGVIERQRTEGMVVAAGIIAHELRTPLASINLVAQGMANSHDALLDGYQQASVAGLPVQRIRRINLGRLAEVTERIQAETARANFVIDLLLTNLRSRRFHAEAVSEQSIHQTVLTALRHYPFRSETEKAKVKWQGGRDFTYMGSQLLIEHVLFNLIKNAIHFTEQVDNAEIHLWTSSNLHGHCLHVFDSGEGIPPGLVSKVFNQFYSSLRNGQATGLGLYFAKQVMEDLGGSIGCKSQLGKSTEFVLCFPKVDAS